MPRNLLALAALLLALSGCGGAGTPRGAESRPCPASIGQQPERRPPADLALVAGAHVFISEGPFGKTERFHAAVDGSDLLRTRDAAAAALVGAGYTLLAKDAEPPIEAEAHLSGPHTVSVQVTSLCAGKLRVRYTISE